VVFVVIIVWTFCRATNIFAFQLLTCVLCTFLSYELQEYSEMSSTSLTLAIWGLALSGYACNDTSELNRVCVCVTETCLCCLWSWLSSVVRAVPNVWIHFVGKMWIFDGKACGTYSSHWALCLTC
jgi:hypothetical protein